MIYRIKLIQTCVCFVAFIVTAWCCGSMNGQDTDAANNSIDFAKDVYPILKRNCVACHFAGEPQGGLNLESFTALMKGGDSGASVQARKVDESLIYERAATSDADEVMPPPDNAVGAKRLTEPELDVLRRWIEQGASEGKVMSSAEAIDWQPIPETQRTILSIATSPNGRWLACNHANRVVIYDLQTRTRVAHLADPSIASISGKEASDVDVVQSISFSPDGRTLATSGYEAVRLWRQVFASAELPAGLRGVHDLVALNGDQSQYARANALGDVEIRSTETGEIVTSLTGQRGDVTQICWPANSPWLFVADETGVVRAYEAKTGDVAHERFVESGVRQLSASQDGTCLAVVGNAGVVQVVRLSTDSMGQWNEVPLSLPAVEHVVVTDLEKPLLVSTTKEELSLIDLQDGKVLTNWKASAPVTSLIAVGGEGGKRILTGTENGEVQLWSLPDGKLLQTHQVSKLTETLLLRSQWAAKRASNKIARQDERSKQLQETLKKEDEALAKVKKALDEATVAAKAANDKSQASQLALQETNASLQGTERDLEQTKAQIVEVTKHVSESMQGKEQALVAFQEAREKLDQMKQELDAFAKTVSELESTAEAKQEEHRVSEEQAQAAKKKQQELQTKLENLKKQREAQQKAVEANTKARQASESTLKNKKQALASATAGRELAAKAIPNHEAITRASRLNHQLLEQRLKKQQSTATRQSPVVQLAVNPSGQTAIAQLAGGYLQVIDLQSGAVRGSRHMAVSGMLSFVGERQLLAVSDKEPSLSEVIPRWEMFQKISRSADLGPVEYVTALAFHPSGRSLAVASGSMSRFGTIQIFDVESGSSVREFERVHSDTVLGLRYSPTGSVLASAAADKTVRLLDVTTGEVVRSLEGHSHHVLFTDWRDDELLLCSASADQSLKIWEAETGEQKRTIGGFGKEISAVAFIERSKQVVSVSGDGQIRVHDTNNGSMLRSMNSGGFLQALSVTPDGKWLFTGDDGGTLRVWDLQNGKLVGEFK